LTNDDALLLIESAVVVVNSGHLGETVLVNHLANNNIYVLQADLSAHGIQRSKRLTSIQQIDYDGFVTLTIEHNVTCYWK
jgi:sulfur relay protein TusB/DsrH